MDLLTEFCKSPDARCPKCGYSLTGLTTGVCPECGEKPELLLGRTAPSRTLIALSVVMLTGLAMESGNSIMGQIFGGWPIAAATSALIFAASAVGLLAWFFCRGRDRVRAGSLVLLFALWCGSGYFVVHLAWVFFWAFIGVTTASITRP